VFFGAFLGAVLVWDYFIFLLGVAGVCWELGAPLHALLPSGTDTDLPSFLFLSGHQFRSGPL
jgi:hypothetical protein